MPCCCNPLNTSSKLWRCSSSVAPVIRITCGIPVSIVIHSLLKNGRCRGRSKWHTNISIQSLVCVDGGQKLQLLAEQHLLVGLGEIQLRELLFMHLQGRQTTHQVLAEGTCLPQERGWWWLCTLHTGESCHHLSAQEQWVQPSHCSWLFVIPPPSRADPALWWWNPSGQTVLTLVCRRLVKCPSVIEVWLWNFT